MSAITISDLNNAKIDVDHVAAVATSLELTATDRLGHLKKTLAGAIYAISGITNRGAWVTATAYAIKDIVSNAGTWYVCVIAHTSSGSFGTDEPTKWRVYQGIIAGDLAADDGTQLIGHKYPDIYALATTLDQWMNRRISIWDYIGDDYDGSTNTEVGQIKAHALLASLGGGVIDYENKGIPLLMGWGIYPADNVVEVFNGTVFVYTNTFATGTKPAGASKDFRHYGKSGAGGWGTSSVREGFWIFGGSARVYMNRNTQVAINPAIKGGGISGYSGLNVSSSGDGYPDLASDFLKVKNVNARDITFFDSGYDGTYVSAGDGVTFENVTVIRAQRISHVTTGGRAIRRINCEGSYQIGDNPAQDLTLQCVDGPGAGYSWNEPDRDDQTVEVTDINPRGYFNYGTTCRTYNNGRDTHQQIKIVNPEFEHCHWDSVNEVTLDSAAQAHIQISLHDVGAAELKIEIINTRLNNGKNALVLINRGKDSVPGQQEIIFRGGWVTEGCTRDAASVNSSPVTIMPSVGTSKGDWATATAYVIDDKVIYTNGSFYRCVTAHTSGIFLTDVGAGKWVNLRSPKISFIDFEINAALSNTNPVYGFSIGDPDNVHIHNPKYTGAFLAKCALYGNIPDISNRDKMTIDPGTDDTDGVQGGMGKAGKFFIGSRLAHADSDTEPTIGRGNEWFVWRRVSNNRITLQFKPYNNGNAGSTNKVYLHPTTKSGLFGTASYAGGSISPGSPASGTITVTGAEVGDHVDPYFSAADDAIFPRAKVTATDTVKWYLEKITTGSATVSAGTVDVFVTGRLK